MSNKCETERCFEEALPLQKHCHMCQVDKEFFGSMSTVKQDHDKLQAYLDLDESKFDLQRFFNMLKKLEIDRLNLVKAYSLRIGSEVASYVSDALRLKFDASYLKALEAIADKRKILLVDIEHHEFYINRINSELKELSDKRKQILKDTFGD